MRAHVHYIILSYRLTVRQRAGQALLIAWQRRNKRHKAVGMPNKYQDAWTATMPPVPGAKQRKKIPFSLLSIRDITHPEGAGHLLVFDAATFKRRRSQGGTDGSRSRKPVKSIFFPSVFISHSFLSYSEHRDKPDAHNMTEWETDEIHITCFLHYTAVSATITKLDCPNVLLLWLSRVSDLHLLPPTGFANPFFSLLSKKAQFRTQCNETVPSETLSLHCWW